MTTLIDLFSCEGIGAIGYHQAGFTRIIGVDSTYQRRYPFEFIHADWQDGLAQALAMCDEPPVIHASPPCQAYSITKHSHSVQHPELVELVREALQATGLPYIIENVVGAPLHSPILLCGTMFARFATDEDGQRLFLERHRIFESSLPLRAPNGGCRYTTLREWGWYCAGVYGGGSSDRRHAQYVRRGGYTPGKAVREDLIGVTGATMHGLSQAIPPCYTKWVGRQVLAHHPR